MKILVFSDSHGNEDNMVRAVERERPSTLDAIVHLGDGWRDAEALHRLYPRIPLEQVPGNCDLGRFDVRISNIPFTKLSCSTPPYGFVTNRSDTRTSRTSTTTMGCGSSIPAASATIAARPTGC